VIGVVTGANSLITIPVMLQFGIDPRVATATNMLALTFMSVGGALPFVGKGVFDTRRLPLFIALTLLSSAAGAWLVTLVSAEAMSFLIAFFMLGVAIFVVLNRRAGVTPKAQVSRGAALTGYVMTFLLGVYGGFFSGGYVTMLTTSFVALFGMTFMQAVATTKIINIFSSLVATAVYVWAGLIDWPLGLALSAIMFVGALLGGRLALKLDNTVVRQVFLVVVIALAIKTLVFDLQWSVLFRMLNPG
jgi:uncharacterized membrane protein YfcA